MGGIVNTTIQDNKITVDLKGGTITIWPVRSGQVRVESQSYTINGVEYQFTAHASLRDGVWEITYLGGDRTPWRTPKDFGFTRSARDRLRIDIPTLLSLKVTPEADDLFADAEAERRRIDAIGIQNQLDRHNAAATVLRGELRKCQGGGEYTPYPINEGRA